MTPLRAIRKNCLECSLQNAMEVRLCATERCPVHIYRFGHRNKEAKMTPLKSIRKKCLDCSGWERQEVKECHFDGIKDKKCFLYPFRLGHNPNRRGMGSFTKKR